MTAARAVLKLVESAREDQIAQPERRSDQRSTPAELPWLRTVRLKYGPAASVIDVSSGGAQLEFQGHALNPGANVVIEIGGDGGETAVLPSRVVRCHISQLAESPVYRSAVEFKRRLELPRPDALALPRLGHAYALREHARLLQTLRRLDLAAEALDDRSLPGGGSPLGTRAMAAALAALESAAARRAGPAFTAQVVALFTIVARGLEQAVSGDVLLARIVERLRLTLRAAQIDVSDRVPSSAADAIYFDVPSPDSASSGKLLVEFPRSFEPEEWHLVYLRAAAHLVALAQEIEHAQSRRRAAAPPLAQRTVPGSGGGSPFYVPAQAAPAGAAVVSPGMSSIVVRYMDGERLKGYTRDFLPSRGIVQVWPAPGSPPEQRVTVPFGQLKAIFFVRDLDGDSAYIPDENADASSHGRKVTVTFLDGEQIRGTTMTYQPDGPGFFLCPLDTKGNNVRVFVASRAIRHVRFPE